MILHQVLHDEARSPRQLNEAVPRDLWESIFRAQGMKNPTPRMQMIDGFNAGWIDFPNRGANARKGCIGIDQAIATMIQRALT